MPVDICTRKIVCKRLENISHILFVCCITYHDAWHNAILEPKCIIIVCIHEYHCKIMGSSTPCAIKILLVGGASKVIQFTSLSIDI